MRDIYEDMVEAEAAMASMGAGCWGLCVPCQEKLNKCKLKTFQLLKQKWCSICSTNFFSLREPDPECFNEYAPKGGGGPREGLSMEGVPTFGGFIAKYTNDKAEEEMEQNMEEVSNCIGNLRNMG